MCLEIGQRHVGETDAMRSRNLVDKSQVSCSARTLGFMLCQTKIEVFNVRVSGVSHLKESVWKLE